MDASGALSFVALILWAAIAVLVHEMDNCDARLWLQVIKVVCIVTVVVVVGPLDALVWSFIIWLLL